MNLFEVIAVPIPRPCKRLIFSVYSDYEISCHFQCFIFRHLRHAQKLSPFSEGSYHRQNLQSDKRYKQSKHFAGLHLVLISYLIITKSHAKHVSWIIQVSRSFVLF